MKNIVKWQTIFSFSNVVISLLQIAILSRFVSLSDFGLIAIVMVIINFSQVLSDLGMSNYLVYRKEITDTVNSTVFWMCAISGICISAALNIISPLISFIYDDNAIGHLLSIIALNFIPISLGAQLQSRYISNFNLNIIATFDFLSKTTGAIISIYMAYLGNGAISIILGYLTSSFIKLFLVWFFSPLDWKPKFMFSKKEAQLSWDYGKYQIGSQLINQYRSNLDMLLLGLFVSSDSLGAYSLAKQLTQRPMSVILPIIQKITLPYIAKLQDDLLRLKVLIAKSHTYVSIFLMFPYVLLCVMNQEVVFLMYGEDKLESISPLIIPLSLFWLFRSVGGGLVGSLTQGLGKTKNDFYWNLSVSILFTIVCFIFSRVGVYPLAWSITILQLVLMNFVYLFFYKRLLNLKYKEYIYPILLFLTLSFASIYMTYSIADAFFSHVIFKIVSITCISMVLYYILGYRLTSKLVYIPSYKDF